MERLQTLIWMDGSFGSDGFDADDFDDLGDSDN